MINALSLAHIKTGINIFLAMRRAVKFGAACVRNRKGGVFLSVEYLTGDIAWRLLGKSSGFVFRDTKGRDVSALVLQSLKNVT